jgi:hypothetical protein
MMCGRLEFFPGTIYSWNIVENGVKHHGSNLDPISNESHYAPMRFHMVMKICVDYLGIRST